MRGGWASGWMTLLRRHSTFSCSSIFSHTLTVFDSNASGGLPARDGESRQTTGYALRRCKQCSGSARRRPTLCPNLSWPAVKLFQGNRLVHTCVGPSVALVGVRGSTSARMEVGPSIVGSRESTALCPRNVELYVSDAEAGGCAQAEVVRGSVLTPSPTCIRSGL